MGAQAVDNSNLLDYRGDQGVSGFTPSVSFAVSGTNVTVTDNTTYPAGDGLKKVHVKLQDDFGGEVRGTITTTGAPGAQVVSSSTLDRSKGLKLVVTVISNQNRVADGNAVNIGAAGNIASWDTQKNA